MAPVISAPITNAAISACFLCRRRSSRSFSKRRRLFSTKNCSQSSARVGLDEFPMKSRLTGDGGLGADDSARAGHRALGEVFGKLGVPRAGALADRALGGHAFLYCAAPVVSLVGLHWSPLR